MENIVFNYLYACLMHTTITETLSLNWINKFNTVLHATNNNCRKLKSIIDSTKTLINY